MEDANRMPTYRKPSESDRAFRLLDSIERADQCRQDRLAEVALRGDFTAVECMVTAMRRETDAMVIAGIRVLGSIGVSPLELEANRTYIPGPQSVRPAIKLR